MNTVSPNLLSGIVYESNAYLVWEDLKERFDKVNCMRIFQLHREIAMISQGTDSVSDYFTKLKELWAEFDVMVPSQNCGCPKGKENFEHLQQLCLLQFFSGLNDSYDQARRQILMKTSEPTLNKAYALIIEDESKKSGRFVPNSIVEGNDITALWSAKGSQQKFRKNSNDHCDFCKLQGHVKKNCYRLIGYPENWKGRKLEGIPGIAANSSSYASSQDQ